MKRLHWPRPPLLLGFVLGGLLERYLYISVTRFGAEWLLNPIVVGVLVLAAWGLARPLIRHIRTLRRTGSESRFRLRPRFDVSVLFYFGLIVIIAWMIFEAYSWSSEARTVPLIIGWFALAVLLIGLLNHTLRLVEIRTEAASRSSHLDLTADDAELGPRTITLRALRFAIWAIAFVGSTAIIGLLPSILLLVLLYMRFEGGERWSLSLLVAITCGVLANVLFDQVLALPWPHSLLGDWIPALRQIIPST